MCYAKFAVITQLIDAANRGSERHKHLHLSSSRTVPTRERASSIPQRMLALFVDCSENTSALMFSDLALDAGSKVLSATPWRTA
jgi:hypothetical protein